jgi:hypothetical protein
METKVSQPTIHRVGKVKLTIIMLLVITLPIGALMVAVLRSEYGMRGLNTIANPNTEQSVSSDVDFGLLVDKYKSYYTINDNGTATLDLASSTTRSQAIDPQDMDALQQHSKMLDNINTLVDAGVLHIDDNGEYRATQEYLNQGRVASNRDLSWGSYDFYIRTSWWIPVGYHFELGTWGAILFGVITAVASYGGKNMVIGKTAKTWLKVFIESLYWTGNTLAVAFLNANMEKIFAVVYGVYVGGMIVATAISAFTGGGGAAVVGLIIQLLGSLLWATLGNSFLWEGILNAGRPENTVEIETNLLLLNKRVWVSRK